MEDETKKPSETVPGGRYIRGDEYIDANGKVLGKVESAKTESAKTETKEVKK